ncbi:FecR protein [Anaerohalosphaera lusitana]|uniref:FecR protein n=1 Tax=Anaerohalosphaera lusitana TaxID=1936003 RepID=A0A1U9NL09_9BACT|nr:FecR domain-containing protein [Anaerohalosphaera lusitana]AQT68196.1 FecR protein [Anaerohalosphaera lusitana]
MDSPFREKQFDRLVTQLIEGNISPERLACLNELLEKSAEARNRYIEITTLAVGLRKQSELHDARTNCNSCGIGMSNEVWTALAANEMLAEAVDVPRQQPDDGYVSLRPTSPVEVSRKRVISKFALATAALSSAAMFVIAMLLIFTPARPPVVATLVENAGAEWSSQFEASPGADIRMGKMHLQQGFAKLAFFDGTKLIVQAPAEFDVEGEDQIYLHSGRVFARMDGPNVGFTVRTPGATVVDYGTEFGVSVDSQGRTEAHVFKGRVDLRSGSDARVYESSIRLSAGQASAANQNGTLSEDAWQCNHSGFVQSLPPEGAFGWPGQRLDLADIIGGGNGFGTGQQERVIHPKTGEVADQFVYSSRKADGKFSPVASLKYVDGVFVPNASEPPQQISSAGHTFAACPDTTGKFYRNIANGFGQQGSETLSKNRKLLNGVSYGSMEKPAISMHANLGVTFDLDSIRADNPGMRIDSFSAICGVAGSNPPKKHKAGFFVLVDGQVRFQIHASHSELTGRPCSISIRDNDRYLTLVTTDGGDSPLGDWCMFAMPALELEYFERQQQN